MWVKVGNLDIWDLDSGQYTFFYSKEHINYSNNIVTKLTCMRKKPFQFWFWKKKLYWEWAIKTMVVGISRGCTRIWSINIKSRSKNEVGKRGD